MGDAARFIGALRRLRAFDQMPRARRIPRHILLMRGKIRYKPGTADLFNAHPQ